MAAPRVLTARSSGERTVCSGDNEGTGKGGRWSGGGPAGRAGPQGSKKEGAGVWGRGGVWAGRSQVCTRAHGEGMWGLKVHGKDVASPGPTLAARTEVAPVPDRTAEVARGRVAPCAQHMLSETWGGRRQPEPPCTAEESRQGDVPCPAPLMVPRGGPVKQEGPSSAPCPNTGCTSYNCLFLPLTFHLPHLPSPAQVASWEHKEASLRAGHGPARAFRHLWAGVGVGRSLSPGVRQGSGGHVCKQLGCFWQGCCRNRSSPFALSVLGTGPVWAREGDSWNAGSLGDPRLSCRGFL